MSKSKAYTRRVAGVQIFYALEMHLDTTKEDLDAWIERYCGNIAEEKEFPSLSVEEKKEVVDLITHVQKNKQNIDQAVQQNLKDKDRTLPLLVSVILWLHHGERQLEKNTTDLQSESIKKTTSDYKSIASVLLNRNFSSLVHAVLSATER